jgi:mono/diheme cytochrome c family protein
MINRFFLFLMSLILPVVAAPSAVRAAEADPELTKKALAVLDKTCSRCHGKDGTKEGGVDYILDVKKLIEKRKVVPGAAEKSRLYQRVANGDMPCDGEQPRPTKEEIALLKVWIDGGDPAAAPPVQEVKEEKRSFVSLKDNLTAMLAHQQRTDREARHYQRYFTLTNLYNNPAVSGQDLRLYEAALAKLLNSLSWKRAVVVPQPVDEQRTVFVVDVRKLDWDRHNLWLEVLKAYPYGLKHQDYPDDDATRKTAEDLYELAGTELPDVRIDWFIATAARPPLYHTLLQLPKDARELERRLSVDVRQDFLNDDLARAGFTASGISRHNRMVERHESHFGAYWKSYDFKSDDGTANLNPFPLGPKFEGNTYNDQAFEHAGGEIIFNLPNGLQGYLLVNAKDERIDEGPVDIVRDKTETSGSVAVVNGISCMSCHQHGMIKDFKDGVRLGAALKGQPRDKLRKLYAEPAAMTGLLEEDESRFLSGLDRATGLFLKVGTDAKKDIQEFPEEIGPLARLYKNREVGAAEAAYELGFKDADTLKTVIESNGELARLGVKALSQGGTLKREFWESDKGLTSVFQETARILRRGTPQRER